MKEIRSILSPLGITIVGLGDFPQIGDIDETGSTLLENSLIKARTVFKKTSKPSLADDTGLEVDCLGGRPGVLSARFAGQIATPQDNIKKLLKEMINIGINKRTARFRTIISFFDGENEFFSEGIIEGSITKNPIGKKGFGYDPIFMPKNSKYTFGQINEDKKNLISHRALALSGMKEKLIYYFKKKGSI